MTRPHPVLEEPRGTIPETRARAIDPGVTRDFDPKDSFFPQALLQQFEEAPRRAPRAMQPRRRIRVGVIVACASAVLLGTLGWAGLRWHGMRAAGDALTAAPAAPQVGATPAAPTAVVATQPVVVRPVTAAPSEALPSATVPVAAVAAGAGVSPVTHTRNAAHAAPAPSATVEEKPVAAAAASHCAQPIAALGLCGTASERKSP